MHEHGCLMQFLEDSVRSPRWVCCSWLAVKPQPRSGTLSISGSWRDNWTV